MRSLVIGDAVTTPSGQSGILRWTGRINGKPIEYAGIELTSGKGLHSGEHEGHKYFETSKPGTGIFVSYSKLVSANITTPLSRLGNSRLPALSPGKQQKTSRAASPISPQRVVMGPPQSNTDEVARLNALLEDREARIKDLKSQIELRRTEFRKHIESIEADRNQMAEQYENMLREYSEKGAVDSEIDVQRTALAAMQNKLMEENEQMRLSLEVAKKEAEDTRKELAQLRSSDTRGPSDGQIPQEDLDTVLKELSAQETRLAELQDSVQELDQLRAYNSELLVRNKELEERCAEMEGHLNEVAELKDSLAELTIMPESKPVDDAAIKEAKEEAEKAKKEAEKLKVELEHQKKRSQKLSQEAEQARQDAQMYFKMSDPDATERDKKKISDLEAQVAELQKQLDSRASAPSAPAPASVDKPTPVKAVPTEIDHERELEDQILREAGLLDTPAPARPHATSQPASKIDPTAGRELWCGLCERSGHTSIECPYED